MGLALLDTATVSGSQASIKVSSTLITALTRALFIEWFEVFLNVDPSGDIAFRTSGDGGASFHSTAGDYRVGLDIAGDQGLNHAANKTNETEIRTTNSASSVGIDDTVGRENNGEMWIWAPFESNVEHLFVGKQSGEQEIPASSDFYYSYFHGRITPLDNIDGIQMRGVNGSFTKGELRLYGLT